MKYSFAAAALALASGVVAKPQITNSGDIDPKEGKSFTLELSGCSSGCTVYLMQGPKDSQVPVKVLDCKCSLAVFLRSRIASAPDASMPANTAS